VITAVDCAAELQMVVDRLLSTTDGGCYAKRWMVDVYTADVSVAASDESAIDRCEANVMGRISELCLLKDF